MTPLTGSLSFLNQFKPPGAVQSQPPTSLLSTVVHPTSPLEPPSSRTPGCGACRTQLSSLCGSLKRTGPQPTGLCAPLCPAVLRIEAFLPYEVRNVITLLVKMQLCRQPHADPSVSPAREFALRTCTPALGLHSTWDRRRPTSSDRLCLSSRSWFCLLSSCTSCWAVAWLCLSSCFNLEKNPWQNETWVLRTGNNGLLSEGGRWLTSALSPCPFVGVSGECLTVNFRL